MTNGPVKIVDLSHYQEGFDFDAFKSAGGLAVILKATEGGSIQDASYKLFRQQALDAGLGVASYHFFRPGDPVAQAEYYLNFAEPLIGARVVCDFEDEATTIADVVAFLQAIQAMDASLQLTLYSGHLAKDQLGDSCNAWLAANTSLWLAQYMTETPSWPSGTWGAWSLWQFSDQGSVAGFSGAVDCNRFNGPDDNLLAWIGPAEVEPSPPEHEVVTITISADQPVQLRVIAGDNVEIDS